MHVCMHLYAYKHTCIYTDTSLELVEGWGLRKRKGERERSGEKYGWKAEQWTVKTQRWAEEIRSAIILNWPSYSTVNASLPLHPHSFSCAFTQSVPTQCLWGQTVNPKPTIFQRQPTKEPSLQIRTNVMTLSGNLQKRSWQRGIPYSRKWEIKKKKKKLSSSRRIAMFSCCCVCNSFSHSMRLFIFILHDSQIMRWHEWVTFVSNKLDSASCQRSSVQMWCLGFLFNSV